MLKLIGGVKGVMAVSHVQGDDRGVGVRGISHVQDDGGG